MGGLRLKICERGIVPGENRLLFFTWGGVGWVVGGQGEGRPCLGAGQSVERTRAIVVAPSYGLEKEKEGRKRREPRSNERASASELRWLSGGAELVCWAFVCQLRKCINKRILLLYLNHHPQAINYIPFFPSSFCSVPSRLSLLILASRLLQL